MAHSGTLSTRQRKFITALVSSPTIEAAAKVAGIGRRTGFRYLQDPAVKAELARLLDGLQGQATRRVVASMSEALEVLRGVYLDDESPTGAKVSAAKCVLDSGPRLRESGDLAERLALLEQQLTGGSDE
jgi:phage terminase small subunit